MAVFTKCPVCGEFAFVQPELGGRKYKVFKCGNGHTFRKSARPEVEDGEIWDHMPEWAKTLNGLSKQGN